MKKTLSQSWSILVIAFVLVTFSSTKHQVENAIVPPPWSDPVKNPCATMPGGWQLIYWPPLKKCFKIFKIGYPCPDTMELSPAASTVKMITKNGITAECKCPPGTAQSAITNKCHNLFKQGPCENGQYFSPVQEYPGKKTSTPWGVCKTPKRCPNKMSFWPKNSKCYDTYSRGPCPKGKLLVNGADGLSECKCENNEEMIEYFYKAEQTCHEHYKRGPCQSDGQIFLPGGKCGCSSELPNYHIESNQCFEFGTFGPCPPGHIYTVPDDKEKIAKYGKCQCKEGYILWTDGLCYRLYTRGPCQNDEFLINSTLCVRNFCGKGKLYFPEQKTCYRIGSQGPCSLHQVVIFDFTSRPSIDGISYNGICGCSGVILNLDQQCTNGEQVSQKSRCDSSPGMIELNGICYKLYSRGPCGPGQWLEPEKNLKDDNNKNDEIINKAKCKCRPGYESYKCDGCISGCYAPSVGLARYLNGQNYNQTYKLQFKRFSILV